MIPIYRYMDSHPFQKSQMPFNPYQYPSMETIPSYMMMDPAKSCMPHHDSGRSCWHYGYPMPSYSCCNGGGNFFPGYYNFRPPHLSVPSHKHMHCYGGYPPCPEPYYVQYVPPTQYNVEQPRYEFDKSMKRNHHCCGCPNSLCGQNQKEDKCVKIEEEKPDFHRQRSLIPIQLRNDQSPIVWIPPDYMGSEKENEPSERGTGKQEKEHRGLNSTENLKAVEKAPKFWNDWPLSDLNHLGSWLPDAEGMGTQSVQNKQQEDGKREFPFPVIWMPAFGREESAKKDVQNMDAPRKYTEEPSNVGKLVPRLPTNTLQKDDASSEGPEVVKTVNQSNVPEMDMNHKTEDKINKEKRCIPVETVKDMEEKELSRNNVKGQSSSSPKKSRLPPVCLRVDPLPKKKIGNGSSRSQSSPKSTVMKESSQLDSEINNTVAVPNSEKIIKAVEVKPHESLDANQRDKEDISSTGEPLSLPAQPQPQEKFFDKLYKEETEENTTEEYREKDRTISQAYTEKAFDEGMEVSSGDLVHEEGKNKKPYLSDVEAAVLIQSAYRGYEVRKWELLKKMKQLAEVRQQVIEVQNRVMALELAPQDEKEIMFVGEMIMRLLLKLDTIQGLHSSVREFRKSLAKELVALQEKLDCVVINKPAEVVPEASMEKPVEQFDVETHNDIKEEEQHKDDVVAIGEIFPEGENASNSLLGESHGAQPLCGIADMAGFEGMTSSTDKGLQEPPGDGNSKLPEVNDKNTKAYEAEELVEVREPRVQNEDTFELSSHNFSKHLEHVVLPSLMEDKKPEEAESEAEMERNVELVTDAEQKVGEVLQTDMKEETVNYQAYSLEDVHPAEDSLEVDALNSISDDQVGAQAGLTPRILDKIAISAPDENGQTEDQLAADMELSMREDNNSNNLQADKLEHIEMRGEVSEAEENAHDLEVELGSDRTPNEMQPEGQEECHVLSVGSEQNEECLSYTGRENENKGASDESAGLPGEQSNSNDDLNIQDELVTKRNEQQTADEEEKVVEDVQHQPMPSSELDNRARQACDGSAELLEELSESYHDQNIQNEMVTEKNEQKTADEESKMEKDMLQEPRVLDPMPSNKLDNQANKLHAAGVATLDGTSTEMGQESMPVLPNPNAGQETIDKHDWESEKEMDKKVVEENEKMKEMVEKLMEAGKEQIAIISKLSGRVKDLEKRLARKKKLRRGCGMPISRHPMLNGRIKA